MPVPQLRALLKQPGIKQEEIKWSGIDEFLAGKEGKIAKQEVLDFLEAEPDRGPGGLKGEKQGNCLGEERDGSYSADDESGAAGKPSRTESRRMGALRTGIPMELLRPLPGP